MTKEGRLATHKHCLELGRPSPYADEFKPLEEPVKEEPKVKKPKKKKGAK